MKFGIASSTSTFLEFEINDAPNLTSTQLDPIFCWDRGHDGQYRQGLFVGGPGSSGLTEISSCTPSQKIYRLLIMLLVTKVVVLGVIRVLATNKGKLFDLRVANP